MKLLIVEDNNLLTISLKQNLRRFFTIDFARSGEEALEYATANAYDAIVLDLGLPDIDGQQVCQEIRAKGIQTPILVATGIRDPARCIKLLECGADDYITKPYDMEALRHRLDALAHRVNITSDTLKIGELTINLRNRTVLHGKTTVPLRKKEFDLLKYLAINQGRTITRAMVLDHIWADEQVTRTTVDVHIKHLRDKIDKPFNTSYIKTIHKLGYSMVDNTG